MRIAIVADWLTTVGGAERALLELHTQFPTSPIFTTVCKKNNIGALADADIRTSGLQRIYRLLRNHQVLLPFLPRAVESLDLSGYDIVLSSSHAVGKGVIVPPTAVHVCYCHTPMRYAWEMERQYLDDFGVPNFLRKKIRTVLRNIRRWDLTTAKRVDVFIANSNETASRISRIYGRESIVIPPPVQTRFFETPLVPYAERKNFLAIGRLVPYKRFDLAVMAANEMKIPLTIVGSGKELERLKAMAGPTVTFRGRVSDDKLPGLYASAKAVLFPTFEDAGLVPVEAQACGTPVIALNKGGAIDTVINGKTGLFFDEQSEIGLAQAIRKLSETDWEPQAIRKHAERFSAAHFRSRIAEEVIKAYDQFHGKKI